MVIRGRRGEEVKIEEDEEYKKLIESKLGAYLSVKQFSELNYNMY